MKVMGRSINKRLGVELTQGAFFDFVSIYSMQ